MEYHWYANGAIAWTEDSFCDVSYTFKTPFSEICGPLFWQLYCQEIEDRNNAIILGIRKKHDNNVFLS